MQVLFLVVLWSVISVTTAFSQQIVKAGQFRISGVPFNCGSIPTYLYPGGGDIATATPGSINLNWPLYSSQPPAVQAFVYAHECAHHLYGSDENIADCWAVKIGRNQGFLNPGSIQQICSAVYLSPGDWSHFPGPQRCQNMIACFSQ